MWQSLLNWLFDTFSKFGDICDWLFTPIDMNSNFFGIPLTGGFLFEVIRKFTPYIPVTPAMILSITGITAILVIGLIKLINPFS